jgi:hypothetical protein
VNTKIEFPETLEDIVVWAMEHTGDNTITGSYFVQLYHINWRVMTSNQVHDQFCAWLTRIAQHEGAVTHKQQSKPGRSPMHYRVSVAGIFVCVLMEVDLIAMYNGELNVH